MVQCFVAVVVVSDVHNCILVKIENDKANGACKCPVECGNKKKSGECHQFLYIDHNVDSMSAMTLSRGLLH